MKLLVKLLTILIISLVSELNGGYADNSVLKRNIELQLHQQVEFGNLYKENLVACRTVTKSFKENIGSFQSKIHATDDELSRKCAQIKELESQLKKLATIIEVGSCLGKLTQTYDIPIPKFTAVPCDSNLADSGWMVIQRRVDDRISFNRNWISYKEGFGNLNTNFFIGLENLYLLTHSQPHKLYIYMKTFKDKILHASYSNFVIGSEDTDYKLMSIGNFSGNCYNSMNGQLNMKFSTPDRRNDLHSSRICGEYWKSGWWFKNCYVCNLNGVYYYDENIEGIQWYDNGDYISLKFVQMMIKPTIL